MNFRPGLFPRTIGLLMVVLFLSGCGMAGVPTPPGSTPPEKPRAVDKEPPPEGGPNQLEKTGPG